MVANVPRTGQRLKRLEIDLSNPLGRTITHCLPLNGDNREIVTGAVLTYGTGGSIGVDVKGLSLSGNGAAACASVPINLSMYTRVSVSFWMYWNVFANDDDLAIEYGANFISSSGFIVDPNTSGSLSVFSAGVGSSGVSNVHVFSRPTAASWHHYVFNFDRTTGISRSTSVWVDGISQSLSAFGAQSDVVDNFGNNSLYLFSRNNSSLFGAGRMQNLVLRGGYGMSHAEVVAEFNNPWQIFKPIQRRTWSPINTALGDTSSMILASKSSDTASMILASKSSDTASMILATKAADTSSMILNSKIADTSSMILTQIERYVGWAVLNSKSADLAWRIGNAVRIKSIKFTASSRSIVASV